MEIGRLNNIVSKQKYQVPSNTIFLSQRHFWMGGINGNLTMSCFVKMVMKAFYSKNSECIDALMSIDISEQRNE